MIRDELTKLVQQIPFVPFTIEMSSGRQIPVRTRDHIFIGPAGSLIVVADDKGLMDLLPVLHISALTAKEPAA